MTLSPAPGLTRDGVNGIASVTTPAMPCRCQPKTLPTEEYRNGYSIAGCCEGVKEQRTSSSHPHLHGAISCQRRYTCHRATRRRHTRIGMAVIGEHVATMLASHTCTVLSSAAGGDALAIGRPGHRLTQRRNGRDRCSMLPPVLASHTCTVLSQLPEAMRLPSGDQATAFTLSEWPR